VTDIETLVERAHKLLDRLEGLVPPEPATADVNDGSAFRWRKTGWRGVLEQIRQVSNIDTDDLLCIDAQKQLIDQNTRQFIAGLPANNVLLWGPRGTGKSSVIKAIYNRYQSAGLKIIEVERTHLVDLPDVVNLLRDASGRFIIYCDDLSFSVNDDSYKALKVILDGSISETPENILIYATSNRRHLLPETMQDNLDSGFQNGELHMSEAVEEKISLSERFGLWLAFHPFTQDQYLEIVSHWLKRFGIPETGHNAIREPALQWALEHGSRSGRCAWQFARHRAGQAGLGQDG
jgi:hypothetical protein